MIKRLILGIILSFIFISSLNACTRVIYKGCDDRYITSRSMDWKENIPTSLWIFPKGMERDGGAGDKPIKWTSTYGSVVTSGFDRATDDGINEKGLVANLLYLVESDYGNLDNPTISIGAITQYVLDNYANVHDAIIGLKKANFQIIAPPLPKGGEKSGLHLSISDAKGDSAIVEFLNGKMTIHHSKKYKTMTNSPSFDKQLAINSYWEDVNGMEFLPGTNRSPDRFARANFYTNSIECNSTIDEKLKQTLETRSVATAFSIIRNASVPIGITDPKKPNIASTLWRTVADQKALRYYFDSATSLSVIWVDLDKVNLKEGAPVKNLVLTDANGKDNVPNYYGDVSNKFENAKEFLWLNNENNKGETK